MGKLLVSDYDMTLRVIYDFENDLILNANLKALHGFIDRGNTFLLNTGRNYYSIKHEIEKYHIPYHYLACNGGAILLNGDGSLLKCYNMDNSEYNYDLLFELLYKEGVNPHAVLGCMVISTDNNIPEIANKYYLNYNIEGDMVKLTPMDLKEALKIFIKQYPDFQLRTWSQFSKLLECKVSPKNKLIPNNFLKGRIDMMEGITLISELYHTQLKVSMENSAYIHKIGINKT